MCIRDSPYKVCNWTDIDAVITDVKIPRDYIEIFESNGIETYIVTPRQKLSKNKENKELIKKLAKEMYDYNPEQILFVGSGASYCTLYTGYYFLRTNSSIGTVH